jgi:hypothetical protein
MLDRIYEHYRMMRANEGVIILHFESVSRLFRQCGILNISQHYRPPWPVTGIALLYGDGVCLL